MAAEIFPIPVLINPNYAHAQPVVHQIDQGFTAYAKKWRIKPVLREGDALRHTRSAVQAGAEMVVCYGGDKILREVVQGVAGSSIPIGFIPQNFDSILGERLGISPDPGEAVRLFCTSHRYQEIHPGLVKDRLFLLDLVLGGSAAQMTGLVTAPEQSKGGSLLEKLLAGLPTAHYHVVTDGSAYELEAHLCFINHLSPLSRIHPDLQRKTPAGSRLEVVLIGPQPPTNCPLEAQVLNLTFGQVCVVYAAGEVLSIHTDPPQPVWLDGESGGETPVITRLGAEKIRFITAPD